MRAPTLASLLLGLLLAQPASAAVQHPQEPHYGEVLYQYYLDAPFTSLVHLLGYDKRGYFDGHLRDAKLLEGSLKLSYGLLSEAERLFQLYLTDSVPEPVRNRAWYHLARSAYQRGLYDTAARAIAHVKGEVPAELRGEQQLLSALVYMEQGFYDRAVEALRDWQGAPEDEPYARYNLGVALVRNGQLEQGAKLLDAVGRLDADEDELLALKDKANSALGFALLERDPEQARRFLERVRLDGPLSNQALLGAGRADAIEDQHEEALTPFAELSERPSSDPAVQEALISLPFALVQVGAYEQAAQAYRRAVDTFNAERARVDAAERAISRGQLLSVALASEDDLPPVEKVPGRAYLGQVLASHRFGHAIRGYRDLLALQANLDYWSRTMASYDEVLVTQRRHLDSKATDARQRLQEIDLGELNTRYRSYRRQLEDLAAAGAAAEDLATIEAELEDLRQVRSRLLAAQRESAARTTRMSQEVANLKRRIATLRPRIDQALEHQKAVIESLAIQELQARRKRLDAQLSDARYALAKLYDQLATGDTP